MPSLTDEDREVLKWLKETEEKHDVKIEMPTHDHLTITGRLQSSLPEFQWPTFGRRRYFEKPHTLVAMELDYAAIERRIMAYLCGPRDIETVELGGRTYHKIHHPYGGPVLEVTCRKNTEHGCPTCKLLEQLAVDRRKEQMLKEPEEQGTTVECKDCKESFVVSEGEEKFLREKFGPDFAMPVRCKPCREANKQKKAQRNGGGGQRRPKR